MLASELIICVCSQKQVLVFRGILANDIYCSQEYKGSFLVPLCQFQLSVTDYLAAGMNCVMNRNFLRQNKPVVHISDKLRSLRFAMRNIKCTIDSYDDSDKNAIPLVNTVSALANVSDSALKNAEYKFHSYLSSDAKKHFGLATSCSLLLYVNQDQDSDKKKPSRIPTSFMRDERSLQFAGDQYFTAKRIAVAYGIENFLLQQKLFLAVWDEFRLTLEESLLSKRDDVNQSMVYSLCAQYAHVLKDNSIVVFPRKFVGVDTRTYDTKILIPATIALVTAIATVCDLNGIKKDDQSIYGQSVSLMMARYSQLEKIFKHPDSIREFEKFIAAWTPRLS